MVFERWSMHSDCFKINLFEFTYSLHPDDSECISRWSGLSHSLEVKWHGRWPQFGGQLAMRWWRGRGPWTYLRRVDGWWLVAWTCQTFIDFDWHWVDGCCFRMFLLLTSEARMTMTTLVFAGNGRGPQHERSHQAFELGEMSNRWCWGGGQVLFWLQRRVVSKVVSTHLWSAPLNLYQQAIKGFLS